ncbi:SDR family oxidoreductase [Zeaxanthinibacter sp. PT1]|uniref:enoyl-ACP reductase FabI n=1 Tax=Zeaxanthinibacter TaxID=561554 RepID=UPI0023491400|nr:SDR family oxidoreductase [Zeaxanthinibacter sp. PT1]MDC6351468.1 SDR family oxidoreductase [Zeaxanthinibacter sp. PT1]
MTKNNFNSQWALILGGSHGLGLATAKKLASAGYNLIILHRDRKADLSTIDEDFEFIRSGGTQCIAFNTDALNKHKREQVIDQITTSLGKEGKIKVVVHSIAKGNLKPMTGDGPLLEHEDFLLTLDAMAVSLYDWMKILVQQKLTHEDCRVIAFTSEGKTRVIPNYAAVSSAKAALESICQNMALAYAPMGVRVNCIQAGVTDTRSLRMIPGSEKLLKAARERNPSGRLTLAEDVANAVYLLTLDEARWITGTTITVDGGESLR